MSEEIKARPTSSGKCVGYIPEYKNDDGIWKPIPLDETGKYVQRAHLHTGLFHEVHLLGYEAAMAIAWAYLANEKVGMLRETRLVPYKVEYEIKAFKDEIKAQEINSRDMNKLLTPEPPK